VTEKEGTLTNVGIEVKGVGSGAADIGEELEGVILKSGDFSFLRGRRHAIFFCWCSILMLVVDTDRRY
jgi:hypothetical protein